MSLKNFPDYKTVATDLLIPYARNSRTHSAEQIAQIAASIKEFGFLNPIIIDGENGIIAGHGRVMAAQKLGIDELPCVEAKHLTEAQRKAYVIADNKLALNAGWDNELLRVEFDELKDMGFEVELTGFSLDEIDDLLDIGDDENPYTKKVEIPTYEPSDEKPSISELCDLSKVEKLLSEIEKSKLPEDEKRFLFAAAYRHAIFDFSKVADYYAHSEISTQELFENSALVIVDFGKAIEQGFVRLNEKIAEQYLKEAGDNE